MSVKNSERGQNAPGRGLEGPPEQGRSDPKKFFFQKNACFGRKSRMGRFFKKKKLPKIYHTTY